MTSIPNIRLNNGVEIPQLGFGVFQIERSRTVETVLTAFDAGYRHIDTAQMYGNEAEVGEAVEECALPRSEIFITTKLHIERHGRASAIAALDESLERLRTGYVDLYLIHWPMPDQQRYVETWAAFETLLNDGRARAIGVSNLQIGHLVKLAEYGGAIPALNQIELHPNLQQAALRDYHAKHAIVTEAWSPIARGGVLNDQTIARLAVKYGKTPAQVVLRWQLQLGNIVLSRSKTPSRIHENVDLLDFEIDDRDMAIVAGLDGDPAGAPSRTLSAGLPYWSA